VVPLLLCAPKFLDGSMTLGQVMQAASAFTIVQSAFNWLVDKCMSSEHFGQLAWQFKRMSGSSGLKVQAAIAC